VETSSRIDGTTKNKYETLRVDYSLREFATSQEFEKEIPRVISESEERKMLIRNLRDIHIRVQYPKHEDLNKRLKRLRKHDLDFITYSKYRRSAKKLHTPRVTLVRVLDLEQCICYLYQSASSNSAFLNRCELSMEDRQAVSKMERLQDLVDNQLMTLRS